MMMHLHVEHAQGHMTEEKGNIQMPHTWQDSNPWSHDHEVCALPQIYSLKPSFQTVAPQLWDPIKDTIVKNY